MSNYQNANEETCHIGRWSFIRIIRVEKMVNKEEIFSKNKP